MKERKIKCLNYGSFQQIFLVQSSEHKRDNSTLHSLFNIKILVWNNRVSKMHRFTTHLKVYMETAIYPPPAGPE